MIQEVGEKSFKLEMAEHNSAFSIINRKRFRIIIFKCQKTCCSIQRLIMMKKKKNGKTNYFSKVMKYGSNRFWEPLEEALTVLSYPPHSKLPAEISH